MNDKLERTGYVLMLDALGVKNLSLKESHIFLERRNKVRNVIEERTEYSSQIMRAISGESHKINEVTFGDTLILSWDFPEEIDSSEVIGEIAFIASSYISFGLENNLKLRGAISFGNHILDEDNSTILGPAISDAANWYERAEWIGVMATPQADQRLQRITGISDGSEYHNTWLRYKVPLNNPNLGNEGIIETFSTTWVIRYIQRALDKTNTPYQGRNNTNFREKHFSTARKLFLSDLEEFDVPIGTEMKYKNTIEYFDHCLNLKKDELLEED